MNNDKALVNASMWSCGEKLFIMLIRKYSFHENVFADYVNQTFQERSTIVG